MIVRAERAILGTSWRRTTYILKSPLPRPNPGQVGSELIATNRIWKRARAWSNPANIWPKATQAWPILANLGEQWLLLAVFWSDTGQFGKHRPTHGQTPAKFGRLWAESCLPWHALVSQGMLGQLLDKVWDLRRSSGSPGSLPTMYGENLFD